MKLIVKNNVGETVSIQIKSNETFLDLKERVEDEAGISLDLKDIALKGKKITETQRVMEYFLSCGEIEDEVTNIYCAVPGCKNTKALNPDKVFFEFPTEEIRCHQWVLYCQRLNVGPGKKRLSLTTESTICSDHFRADQFVKNTNTLLKRTAVPCVKDFPLHQISNLDIHYNDCEDYGSPSESCNNDETNETDFFYEDIEEDTKSGINFRLCRLCASSSNEFYFIFDEVGRHLKIAEKISLCLPIEVKITDELPKQICKQCFHQLNELFEMADLCSRSQHKLKPTDSALFNEEVMAIVDESGEEVALSSAINNTFKVCCPLCNEGNLKKKDIEEKTEVEDSLPILNIQGIDSVILGGHLNIKKCYDGIGDDFSDSECASETGNSKNLNLKMDKNLINFSKLSCDTSDFDSLADSLPSQVFSKDEDPLKIDDNSSKSDNDPIIECYSSFSSPLHMLNAEDSNGKNINEDPLAMCNEELQIEPDLYYSDPESGMLNSTLQKCNENSKLTTNMFNNPFTCRICASEFNDIMELLKHSFVHSCVDFFQCSRCVTFFAKREELENHFNNHSKDDNIVYCDVCNMGFNNAMDLSNHTCKHDSFPPNKCSVCYKFFQSESKLKQHMKDHEVSKPPYCSLCGKTFPDDAKLQKHSLYAHTSRSGHCCTECGKVFKSEASMKYHQKNTHPSDERIKPYTCDRCGKSFMRKSMLANHISALHQSNFETPCFTCKLCNEAFPSTAAAVSHMDNHHKLECMDESTYSFEMLTINRLFACEFCDRCFAEASILNTHREQHSSDAPYECKICDLVFPVVEELKIHRRSHAGDEIPSEYLTDFTIAKTYLCEYCERCFMNFVKYSEHLTIHYGPEPYQCHFCPPLRFVSLIDALDHRSIHGDSHLQDDDFGSYRPYECHYCNKTFTIEDALIKHIRMHTGEKPFICDQCGKGFSQSSGLYTHQKVHSSERPYSCSVCPRKFKIKGDRDVHVRKHSGDRPYKCEFCGKAFMTQHVYSQHRKIHTGERPYKCDVCGIAFRRSHVLTVHKRIHTGEKPNICDICGKRYRQKGDMLKHRRVQHGIVNIKNLSTIVSC